MSDEIHEQTKLDSIQFWLARSTEDFDGWHYDGEELVIILREKEIERYDNEVINDFLRNNS
jgi:hypothetical protein